MWIVSNMDQARIATYFHRRSFNEAIEWIAFWVPAHTLPQSDWEGRVRSALSEVFPGDYSIAFRESGMPPLTVFKDKNAWLMHVLKYGPMPLDLVLVVNR
jgi:hypothetical protein